VTTYRKKWKAKIYYDSKTHNLGSFDTKEEAALAYDRQARQCVKAKLLNYKSIAAAEEAAARAQAGHRQAKKRKELLPSAGPAGAAGGGKRARRA
jgi:hypothetical protein